MEYPKYFFGVFQDLIGDDQVSLSLRQWQEIALNIGDEDLVCLASEPFRVLLPPFYRNPHGIWMKALDHLKIPPSASSEIDYNAQIAQSAHEILDNVRAICFPMIN